jgi:Tol biopolymer transport system component
MPAKAILALMCMLVLGAAGAGAATRDPAIHEIRADGTGQRQVGGRGAIGFALSADGSRFAFLRPGSTDTSLWVMNRDGSGERRLVAGNGEQIVTDVPLAWSPSGDAIAYTELDAACRPGPCADTSVVIVDARDGHRREEIGSAQGLRWTRDGRRVVWACDTEADPYGELESLCFRGRNGGPVVRVSGGFVHRPMPSPDGERVAFTDQEGGHLRIFTFRTRSVRLLADPESAIDGSLTWSPDGRRLAFANAAGELFTIPTARGRPHRIARFTNASTPVWSPRGGRIAFVRSRLWTIRPDGKRARRIGTQVVGVVGCAGPDSSTEETCGPVWSPSGRKLYYIAAQ